MKQIPLSIVGARFLIANSEMLPILLKARDRYQQDHHWPELQDLLKPALKRHIVNIPPHQIDYQLPFLNQKEKSKTPRLLHDALFQISNHVMTWHGAPVLRFENILQYQELSKEITCEQLWVAALVKAVRDQKLSFNLVSDPSQLKHWTQTTIYPSIPRPFLKNLYQKGLIDLHQHYHASDQPISIWIRALHNPKLLTQKKYPIKWDQMNLPRKWTAFDLYAHLLIARFFRRFLIYDERKGAVNSKDRTEITNQVYNYTKCIRRHYRDSQFIPPPDLFPPDNFQNYVDERTFLTRTLLHQHQITTVNRIRFLRWWLFHYYLLIQNIFMQSYVQQDEHWGFEEFSRFERGVGLQAYKWRPVPHALRSYQRDHHLKAIELRLVPEESYHEQRRTFQRLFPNKLGLDVSAPKTGLIFHVIKEPDKPFPKDARVIPPRHLDLRLKIYRQLRAILKAGKHDKEHLRLCLGIDAANDERFARPEVFAPCFRLFRDQYAQISSKAIQGEWDRPRPLKIAFHAGESFHDLLGGIRYVDEALTFLDMRPGDRIGHGLSLGIDPEKWLEMMGPCVHVPGEGYWLDNLVWMDHILSQSRDVPPTIRQYLSRKIEYLSQKIYAPKNHSGILLQQAWECRRLEPSRTLRGYEPFLEMEYKDLKENHPKAFGIWKNYQSDVKLRKYWSGNISIEIANDVPLKDWVIALKECQEIVLCKINAREIAIEVNPTSNLRIGPFTTLHDHPLFEWFPVTGKRLDCTPRVTLNADNYCVFQTTMPLEYAYIARAALDKGFGEYEVEKWLEEIRRNGFKYAFLNEAP